MAQPQQTLRSAHPYAARTYVMDCGRGAIATALPYAGGSSVLPLDIGYSRWALSAKSGKDCCRMRTTRSRCIWRSEISQLAMRKGSHHDGKC